VDHPVDTISYEALVENALRGVLREALTLTESQGLPGQHHFFITFRSQHEGVRMPDRLRAQYPREMTIVLQHQFRDLAVADDWFEVSLSFSGRWERLHVPFEAVSAFADPYAKFGLQFQIDLGEGADDEDEEEAEADLEDGEAAEDAADWEPRPGDEARPRRRDDADTDADPESHIVSLDAFRHKK